jgi:thioredoxin reductase
MKLGVKGEERSKVAYRLLEPREFAGKHVLVVGGGNSAVETALSLLDEGTCRSITLSYRKTQFARCRGSNRARIEAAIAAEQLRAALPSEVQEIGEQDVLLSTGETSLRVPNDAVIVQIGGTPPAQLLKSFGIEIVTKYGEV